MHFSRNLRSLITNSGSVCGFERLLCSEIARMYFAVYRVHVRNALLIRDRRPNVHYSGTPSAHLLFNALFEWIWAWFCTNSHSLMTNSRSVSDLRRSFRFMEISYVFKKIIALVRKRGWRISISVLRLKFHVEALQSQRYLFFRLIYQIIFNSFSISKLGNYLQKIYQFETENWCTFCLLFRRHQFTGRIVFN